MSTMSPLISRRYGRLAPVPVAVRHATAAARSEPGDLSRFMTAFAGGLVFFSILIF